MNKSNLSEINAKNCLVCYLDIIGYKSLVSRHEEDIHIKIYETIDKILKDYISIQSSKKIERIVKTINIKIISDSILLVLDVEELVKDKDLFNGDEEEYYCSYNFLTFCAWIYLKFLRGLEHFVCGGITRGQHYQREFTSDKNLFIFSKALVETAEIEKNEKFPRIVISDSWYDYLLDSNHINFNEYVLRDVDGLYYLDVYDLICTPSGEIRESETCLFRDLVGAINPPKKSTLSIEQKHYWFQTYHNKKMHDYFRNKRISEPFKVNDFLFEKK